MTLIRCDQISIEFGDLPLLINANFSVEPNERVCLIGRNGTGKSTLMKIITGAVVPDKGEVQYRDNLRISVLDQALPESGDETVVDIVRQGLKVQIDLIARYTELSSQADINNVGLQELEKLQSAIDTAGGWQPEQQVDAIISQLGLPPESLMSDLSGGWRRRVALARSLVSQPELLLLDEPTNHLDISTIEWLEHVVRGYRGSVIFITHDRAFLQKLATRIVEIDRGKLISWPGTFAEYLVLKEKANEEEDVRNALFDKRLAQEEVWIRQGIKARRTRNEGRVRALKSLRNERSKRLGRQGKAKITIADSEDSGRKVVEARSIRHGYNGQTLLDDFKVRIMRGDRIGLIGNNGVGKSTLLRILLGRLEPDEGTVKIGTNLEVGYFDQVREELEWDKSVAENVGNGKEFIHINGKDRHIVSYLRNFLFSPKRAMTAVKNLSGGECNRVLLAKLFTRPNNLLVLDEPTNDLDVEMLEVLEEQLVDYQGTLIIVSHDRDFLDNVVTSTLVFEGDGKVEEYSGGYSDWVARGKKLKIADRPDGGSDEVLAVIAAKPKAGESGKAEDVKSATPVKKAVKLSYKFQRELDMLPEKIEKLEAQITLIQEETSAPGFYQKSFDETQPVMDKLSDVQAKLDEVTERWMELEEMASN